MPATEALSGEDVREEAKDTALGLRVATFNLENLGEGMADGASLDERVRLLQPQLLRLRADILCLQEVDSQRRAEGGRALAALAALISGTPYALYHRLTTVSRSRGGPRDKHNLVILSRLAFADSRQIFHDFLAPPLHQPVGEVQAPASLQPAALQKVEWDRPVLYARLALGTHGVLHLVNVHLRAPRAAFVPGGKDTRHVWRSMPGWAEGFFLAAVKRAGQALETRLLIDRIFDAEPGALIAVCGDFNADLHEIPVRTIRGDEEDAGNPHLAPRTLVPLERSLPESRRYSVLHHGRPQMLDHLLVSRGLLAWYRGIEVHNEALDDELLFPQAVPGAAESFHAPLVAEFRLPSR